MPLPEHQSDSRRESPTPDPSDRQRQPQEEQSGNVLTEFARSAWHAGVVRPTESIAQLAGMHTGGPTEDRRQLSTSMRLANMAGDAAGTIFDMMVLSKVTGRGLARILPGQGSGAALAEGTFARSMVQHGTTGALYGGLLTPVQEGESQWRRIGNATVDAGTFMTLGAAHSSLSPVLGNRVLGRLTNNFVSGGAAGITNAQLEGFTHGRVNGVEQTFDSAVSWAIGNAVLGEAMHHGQRGWNALRSGNTEARGGHPRVPVIAAREVAATGDTAGGRNTVADPYAEVRRRAEASVSPEELAARRAHAEQLLTSGISERPSFEQHHHAWTYLQAHPEVDAHVAQLYMERAGNPGVRRLIDGFYRVPGAMEREMAMLPQDVAPRADRLIRWLENMQTHRIDPQRVATNVRNSIEQFHNETGYDIRPSIEQLARLSENPVTVGVIDGALRDSAGNLTTNYARLFDDFGTVRRSLPFTPTEMRSLQTPSWTPAEQWGGLGHALMDARAGRALGVQELAGGEAPRVPTAAERARTAVVQTKIDAELPNLNSPDPVTARRSLLSLSRHLDHPGAAEWYPQWRQSLIETSPHATVVSLESLRAANVSDAVVREFLAAEGPARANSTGNSLETLGDRLRRLQTLAQVFPPDPAAQGPQVLDLLVARAKNDPAAIQQMVEGNLTRFNKNTQTREPDQGYLDFLTRVLQTPQLANVPISNLVGKNGIDRMKFMRQMEQHPELAVDLLAYDAQNPINLDRLGFRLAKGPTSEQARQLVQERLANGATPAELDPEYVQRVAMLRASSEQAAQRIQQMVEGQEPRVLVDLLADPFAEPKQNAGPQRGPRKGPPERLSPEQQNVNRAYQNLVMELANRVESLEELQQITRAIRRQPGSVDSVKQAEEMVRRYFPEPEMFTWASNVISASALRLPSYVDGAVRPPQPKAPADNTAPTTVANPAEPDITLGDVPGAAPAARAAEPARTPSPAEVEQQRLADEQRRAREQQQKDALREEMERVAEEQRQYTETLTEIDRGVGTGGDAELARDAREAVTVEPVEKSAYESMLDNLQPRAGSAPDRGNFALFGDATNAELFAEHVARHVAERTPEGVNVGYRLEPLMMGETEQTLVLLDIERGGQRFTGTPVLNAQGDVIDISPLVAPVDPATQPLSGDALNSAVANLAAALGARTTRR